MPLKETEEMILLPAGIFRVGRGPLGDGNAENIGLRVGLDEGRVVEDGLGDGCGSGEGCGSEEGCGAVVEEGMGSEDGLGGSVSDLRVEEGMGSDDGLDEGASDGSGSDDGLGGSVSDLRVEEGMGSEDGLEEGASEGLDEGSGLTGHIITSHAPAIPEARHILYMSWHAGKVASQHFGVAVGHISISHADATGADARHCL